MALEPKMKNFEEGLTRLENALKELTDYFRAQKSGSRIIEAEKLILVDAEGQVRGKMGVQRDGSSSLILHDRQGTPRTWVGVTPEGSAFFSLKNRSGRIILEMPGAIPPWEPPQEIPLAEDISPGERNKETSPGNSSRTADDVVLALGSHIKTQLANLELKSRRLRLLGGILLVLTLVNLAGLGLVLSRVQDRLMVALPGSITSVIPKSPKSDPVEGANLVPQKEAKKEAREDSTGQVKKAVEISPSSPGPAGAPEAFFLTHPKGASYHYPGCFWVKKVPLDKLRKFPSAKEAREAGYRPCRRCRPPQAD
jgi:hypothetical protein